VAGRKNAGRNAALDQRRQLQKTKGVRDLRTRTTDTIGKFLMGSPEILEQLLVCSCLFQRIQLAAVEVLEQRITKKVVIVRVTHDCGNGFEPSSLDCTPPAFTHDKFVRFSTLFG